MIYMLIAPTWLKESDSIKFETLQGEFSKHEINRYNKQGYGIYYYPNSAKFANPNIFLHGTDIDTFEWVFVDMDLKYGVYQSKSDFIDLIVGSAIPPSMVVDSGGGIHVYWKVSDLTAESFLKFNRRLCRLFKTDDAVSKIKQLMRLPGTINTKIKDDPRPCDKWYVGNVVYTCEDIDKVLPPLSTEDAEYCKRHMDQTFNTTTVDTVLDDVLPPEFGELLQRNQEVKEIWSGNTTDRSKSDYRLACIMQASGFTENQAQSVLVNSPKALDRGTAHRLSYAINIIKKIWTYKTDESLDLSDSIKEILDQDENVSIGTRLSCHRYIDNTERGFRLGDVIGLVAGSGVGKTAMALDMFKGFAQNNPNYDHFFVPLEQPKHEIAERWKLICGERTDLHDKVHVISNYDKDGKYRDLSLDTIQKYIQDFPKRTGRKIGCVVIDHIGALANNNRLGQDEGVKKICKAMKTFALETKTIVIMQSQTARSKAGWGDIELNKDAAFGTSTFENYCDYLLTIWQPLKRCYADGAPTVTAFKFCKIRHKKQGVDKVQEDVAYKRMFIPANQSLVPMTELDDKSFDYWLSQAETKRRNEANDITQYTSITWDT